MWLKWSCVFDTKKAEYRFSTRSESPEHLEGDPPTSRLPGQQRQQIHRRIDELLDRFLDGLLVLCLSCALQ